MRKIILVYNRELLTFLVLDKNIYYSDRKLKAVIRCLPQPINLLKTIRESRNRIPKSLLDIFKFTKEEMDEYRNAKNEEELADIIIKDGKLKGCQVLANVEIEVSPDMKESIRRAELIK